MGRCPSHRRDAICIQRGRCVTSSKLIRMIAHFALCMCFVSASCQTIAAFVVPVGRKLPRITSISPRSCRAYFAEAIVHRNGPPTSIRYTGLSLKR